MENLLPELCFCYSLEPVYYLPPFHWQRKTYLSLWYHTIPTFQNLFLNLLALASLAWGYHHLTLSVQFCFLRQMPNTVNNHFLWSWRLETEMLTAYLAKRLQAFKKPQLLCSYNLSQILFQIALFQAPALTKLSCLPDTVLTCITLDVIVTDKWICHSFCSQPSILILICISFWGDRLLFKWSHVYFLRKWHKVLNLLKSIGRPAVTLKMNFNLSHF